MRRTRGGVCRPAFGVKICGPTEGGLLARINFLRSQTSTLGAPETSGTFGSNLWPSRGGVWCGAPEGGSGAPHQRGGMLRRTRGGVCCPAPEGGMVPRTRGGGGSEDPQDRPKFDLSKMVQNALETAPWGQILSFWPFWTSHWARGPLLQHLGDFTT